MDTAGIYCDLLISALTENNRIICDLSMGFSTLIANNHAAAELTASGSSIITQPCRFASHFIQIALNICYGRAGRQILRCFNDLLIDFGLRIRVSNAVTGQRSRFICLAALQLRNIFYQTAISVTNCCF